MIKIPGFKMPCDEDGWPLAVIAAKNPDGTWSYGKLLDGSVDIELDGTSVRQRGIQVSGTGSDVTLVTPTSGKFLKIYRMAYTVQTDIDGEVLLKSGATVLSRVYNPKAGGNYGFTVLPNYIQCAVDAAFSINAPSGNINIDLTDEEA